MQECVFTIGHSKHSSERLLALLTAHNVTAVADVRSHPYSRFNPQFNRETLQASLRTVGLAYVFLGTELGARSLDRSCYIDGTVQYDLLARTQLFQAGLARVAQGIRSHRVALLCAEKDPLTCHRAILICRHLESQCIGARHILEDGRIESHDEALTRLLTELGFPERDLFRSREEIIAAAYEQRSRQIAFSETQPTVAQEPVRAY